MTAPAYAESDTHDFMDRLLGHYGVMREDGGRWHLPNVLLAYRHPQFGSRAESGLIRFQLPGFGRQKQSRLIDPTAPYVVCRSNGCWLCCEGYGIWQISWQDLLHPVIMRALNLHIACGRRFHEFDGGAG